MKIFMKEKMKTIKNIFQMVITIKDFLSIDSSLNIETATLEKIKMV